jgi:CheY-like chemotaxis protein
LYRVSNFTQHLLGLVGPLLQYPFDVSIQALPDLILLDLMMPELDGFQFVDQIRTREDWRSIPIIVITAKDLNEEDRQRLNGYVEGILQKGAYKPEELLREVCDAVQARVQSR